MLKQILHMVGRDDLVAKVGSVPDYELIDEIKDLLPAEHRKAAYDFVNSVREKNKVGDLVKYVRSVTNPSIPDTDVLRAMMKGIHPETYRHNKTLPLAEKLKLPAWEMIFSLNIKEHKDGKVHH